MLNLTGVPFWMKAPTLVWRTTRKDQTTYCRAS